DDRQRRARGPLEPALDRLDLVGGDGDEQLVILAAGQGQVAALGREKLGQGGLDRQRLQVERGAEAAGLAEAGGVTQETVAQVHPAGDAALRQRQSFLDARPGATVRLCQTASRRAV